MIPLQTFQTSLASPFRRKWIHIPAAPTPWQVMGWGLKQLREFVGGSDSDELDGLGKLQVRDLVIVDNVKVSFYGLFSFGLKIGSRSLILPSSSTGISSFRHILTKHIDRKRRSGPCRESRTALAQI